MKSVSLKAYAKINLGLAVLGRRADGFHELRTVYQTVGLADHLEVHLAAGRRAVEIETSGFAAPAGPDNLAVRAAAALLDELGLRARVLLILRKRIPPGSGLGGASSDAAAVLRAILRLSGKPLLPERLFHLAAALGSDVPFFLVGGRALGAGRGEEVYALPEEPRRHCVLFFPGQGMETAEAYRLLRRPRLTPSSATPTIELFCSRVSEGLSNGLENDFEPVVFRKFPELARVKQAFLRCGAETASLSGSGSAVFALFRDSARARNAARDLRAAGKEVFLTRTVSRREFQASFLPSVR